jgi:hypothetical protein
MNARLSLSAIADYLRAQLPGVHVGTGYDNDFITDFGKRYPAVWVGAQRLQRLDDGRGLTGQYRQHCRVEVVFRLVVQRYAAGVTSPEGDLNTLHDNVAAALTTYRPAGADDAFVWESCQDGELSESVMTADLVMSVTTTYASPT